MITVKRYTASWCGPCKVLAPVMDEIKNELSDVNFVTIDVELHKEAAMNDNIASIPTVVISKNGQELHRFTGVIPKHSILQLIKQFS